MPVFYNQEKIPEAKIVSQITEANPNNIKLVNFGSFPFAQFVKLYFQTDPSIKEYLIVKLKELIKFRDCTVELIWLFDVCANPRDEKFAGAEVSCHFSFDEEREHEREILEIASDNTLIKLAFKKDECCMGVIRTSDLQIDIMAE